MKHPTNCDRWMECHAVTDEIHAFDWTYLNSPDRRMEC